MEEKKKVYVRAAIALAIIFVVWLIMRSRRTVESNVPGASWDMPDFLSPYYQTNPGIYDNSVNNGPVFNSQNNVTVKTANVNGLSNSYMPMFGLVGMTAVGS